MVHDRKSLLLITDGALNPEIGHDEPSPQPLNHVFRLDTVTGAMWPVATDFERPNGLCFSPDESMLFITDSGATHERNAGGEWEAADPIVGLNRHVRVFDVVDGKALTNGRIFCKDG